jgi:molybdate/tungstate transport system substrate-binding protein
LGTLNHYDFQEVVMRMIQSSADRSGRRLVLAAAVVAAAVLGAGLGTGPALGASGRPAPAAKAASKGGVAVLFAGSLTDYMENNFGPSFAKASGYGFEGFGGGSTELASEIRGGVRRGDVFISASATADRSLEGASGGNWVSWYSTFMSSPVELAYNPSSSFGAELARGVPWYKVLVQPGIRVGRTDPALDPKGVLTVEAVSEAARRLRDPALSAALGSFEVFPETSLVGRLQAGQLDAGFFYAVEAHTAGLRTVALAPAYKYALYTLTILNSAPDDPGAAALVRYLLGTARSYTLHKNGLNPIKPVFTGSASAVPAALRRLLGAHPGH